MRPFDDPHSPTTTCPNCEGDGAFLVGRVYDERGVTRQCARCKGTGRVFVGSVPAEKLRGERREVAPAPTMIVTLTRRHGHDAWYVTRLRTNYPGSSRDVFYTWHGLSHVIDAWDGRIKFRAGAIARKAARA